MARYSDEEYLFRQDSIEKKITARSARSTRTHNGKRGAVKFPSDFMSRKELKAMNGKCETYRMNSPLTWDEFKSYPDEHKITYIKLLREKFNVPNTALAEMFDVHPVTLNKYLTCLGLGRGRNGAKKTWNKEGFLAWRSGGSVNAVTPSETPVEECCDSSNETPVEECCDSSDETQVEEVIIINTEKIVDGHSVNRVVPMSGEMTFEGSINDILRAINSVLDDQNVRLTVKWETRRALYVVL